MSVSAPSVVVSAGELLDLLPLVCRTAEAVSAEYSGQTPPGKTPPRQTSQTPHKEPDS
jgi:hypothetical protein